MNRKQVLIVDDEIPALTNMQYALENHPDWQLVASCQDTDQARTLLQSGVPVDLLLLDIEMPEQSGLEFAREICRLQGAPLIVFITAYDQHAVSAFDVFALDFLLKPFDDERFAMMLERASQILQLKQQAQAQAGLPDFLRDRDAHASGQVAPPLTHLVIRSVGKIERVALSDVLWFSAAANYVELHLAQRTVLYRATLGALETRLSAGEFIRLHRTAIVRINAIMRLDLGADGCTVARLCNHDQVRVSESCLKKAKSLFE
jgi:two-component system LytT family response regulator